MLITYKELVELAFFVKSHGFDKVELISNAGRYTGFRVPKDKKPSELMAAEIEETRRASR